MKTCTGRISQRLQALAILAAVATVSAVVGCDAVISGGGPGGTPGPSGTGGKVIFDAPPAPPEDSGAPSQDTGPGPAVDAAGGAAGSTSDSGIPTGGAGGGGSGGSTGSDGGVPSTGDYPAAPAITATQFQVGSVMPNLTFTREDGTPITFKDIRANKKNRLLVWSVGGDNCPPCVSKANAQTIPAWKALTAEGLFILESFNGRGFLVSASPFMGWRRKVPMWPMDGDGVTIASEPKMPPYYALGRISSITGIPWHYMIDLETMTVVNVEGSLSVASLRMRISQLPPRK